MLKLTKRPTASFVRNESGNVAIIFGLLVIPMFGLAAAAVDYSRAFQVRIELQNVADSAALAGTSYYKQTGDADAAAERLRSYVEAGLQNYGMSLDEGADGNGNATNGHPVSLRNATIDTEHGTASPTLSTEIDTTILGVVGFDKMQVTVSTQSQVTGEVTEGTKQLDLALMFDATGSMLETTSTGNSKLFDAKLAAKDLMDIVMPEGEDYNTRISLVPFARNTKVSADVVTAITGSAASQTESNTYTVDVTYASNEYEWTASKSTCKSRFEQLYKDQGQSESTAKSNASNYCKSGSGITTKKVFGTTFYWVPKLGTRQEEKTTTTTKYIKPCMVERAGTNRWSDEDPVTVSGWTASYSTTATADVSCPIRNTVVPLSDSRDTLTDAIDNISTSSYTAGQMGTAWAWYTISPEWADVWPAGSTPLEYDQENTIKAAVLMTDGEYNKTNCSYDATTCPSSPDQALKFCQGMKDKGIIVFTVGFGVGDNETAVNTLTQCASPGKYYFPYDGESMRQAFRDIGSALVSIQTTSSDNTDAILVK